MIDLYKQNTKKQHEGKEGDDKIDNEDEADDRPKSIPPQQYNDVSVKRENRETIELAIAGFKQQCDHYKKNIAARILNKYTYDQSKREIRAKINAQEKKKSRYLNLIEISFPIKIDQFCKFKGGNHDVKDLKLSEDISESILISRNKLKKLEETEEEITAEIEVYKLKEYKISANKILLEKAKKQATAEEKACRDNFIKEQNLKFGTEINFENLIKASKDTTTDKDKEYKQLKKEADNLIDSKRELEESLKRDYQEQVKKNTELLDAIKKLLTKNKESDRSLEEKNNEINKKKEKKYELFNVEEKKEKLKEILKLLKQQMEALKKENEIFRKKGGHIYSTITSNLN